IKPRQGVVRQNQVESAFFECLKVFRAIFYPSKFCLNLGISDCAFDEVGVISLVFKVQYLQHKKLCINELCRSTSTGPSALPGYVNTYSRFFLWGLGPIDLFFGPERFRLQAVGESSHSRLVTGLTPGNRAIRAIRGRLPFPRVSRFSRLVVLVSSSALLS